MTYTNLLDQILSDVCQEEVGLKIASAPGPHREIEEEPLVNSQRFRHHATTDWRGSAPEAIMGTGILSETNLRLANKPADTIEATSTDIKQVASDLFHLGYTPSRVASELEKQAELHAWDRQLMSNTVKEMAGVVGYAYLEPNHFNDSCQDTIGKIQQKGKLGALSVKRIAACGNCNKCVNKGTHCSLFKLPIVASAKELKEVLEQHTGKRASKSTLAALHDGKNNGPKTAAPSAHISGLVGGFGSIESKVEKTLTASHIASAVEASPLMAVYAALLPTYGKIATSKAIKQYVDGLKTSSSQVDVNHIDCVHLKGKLSSKNPIVGSSNCASCTKRCDMHCGLTGGTLLSFPGMDKVKSNKKAHAGSKEGHQILSEYQLEDSSHQVAVDLDVTGYTYDEVDAKGSFNL